jgi:uncharacterized protein YbaP (TraB family)
MRFFGSRTKAEILNCNTMSSIKTTKKKVRSAKRTSTLRILVLTFFVNQASISHAQTDTLLWEIRSDSTETSYIFGTIHLLPSSQFALNPKIIELIQSTDRVILELDMDDPNLQSEMMQNINMKEGQTISSLISPEAYKSLDSSLIHTYGTGMIAFDRWKPFMVASMLYAPVIGEPVASFEIAIVQNAITNRKEIAGLETAKEQLGIFDRIPYEDQAEDLIEMISEAGIQKKEIDEMISLYHLGDINKISEYTKEKLNDQKYYDMLITERNQLWINRISSMTRNQSAFIAVGAGHLGGEHGIINLLKKQGFRVTPVLLEN